MNYLILIIPVILILLVVAIFFLKKKNKQIVREEIPQEILDDFNEAERRLKKARGSKTPEQVLWEITQEKMKGGENGRETNSGTGSSNAKGGISEEGSDRTNPESASIQQSSSSGDNETEDRDKYYHGRLRRLD